jgi:hypothetical protein
MAEIELLAKIGEKHLTDKQHRMNLVNSPREFLPLQFCILTNRPTPDIHDDSALLFLCVARLHTMALPRLY